MRWVDKYKSTNNITRKKRDYTSYKITNSHISFIKQQLKDDKTITMDELLSKLICVPIKKSSSFSKLYNLLLVMTLSFFNPLYRRLIIIINRMISSGTKN